MASLRNRRLGNKSFDHVADLLVSHVLRGCDGVGDYDGAGNWLCVDPHAPVETHGNFKWKVLSEQAKYL